MKKSIRKFSFFVVCIGLLSSLNADDKVYKFTMATTWTETATPLIDSAKNMADMAFKMSNGRIEIKPK